MIWYRMHCTDEEVWQGWMPPGMDDRAEARDIRPRANSAAPKILGQPSLKWKPQVSGSYNLHFAKKTRAYLRAFDTDI